MFNNMNTRVWKILPKSSVKASISGKCCYFSCWLSLISLFPGMQTFLVDFGEAAQFTEAFACDRMKYEDSFFFFFAFFFHVLLFFLNLGGVGGGVGLGFLCTVFIFASDWA